MRATPGRGCSFGQRKQPSRRSTQAEPVHSSSCVEQHNQQLRERLKEEAVTHVVMESTEPYWVPVFNILEANFKVILANPPAEKLTPLQEWYVTRYVARSTTAEASQSKAQMKIGVVAARRIELRTYGL